jgi:DNA mismatch repair protein MutS
MAGMPSAIIEKAEKLLANLESKDLEGGAQTNNRMKSQSDNMQLSFFKLDDPVLESIREEILATDLNTLTPVEAMIKLNDIKKLIIKK